jgi:phenylacetate-coenzyme A ligase PaaK-like adenylate-forming protein
VLDSIRDAPLWKPTRPWADWAAERNARLHRFINEQVYPYSPYYRRVFDANKVDPRSIRSVDDLRRLPFTTKLDIAPTTDNPTRHLDLVLQPDAEKIRKFAPKARLVELAWTRLTRGADAVTHAVRHEYGPVQVIFTTGRTALPTQFVYAGGDMDRFYLVGRRLQDVVGITEEGRSLNVFPFAPHLAFWQVHAVGQAGGSLILHTGGGKVLGTQGNITALTRLQPQVLIGIPGYIYHMLRQASGDGVKLVNLKLIALGGERVPGPLRARLGEMCAQMGAPHVNVCSIYGFTEARQCWAECPPPDYQTSYGFHTYPELDVFEIINPDTGEPVGPGERGELVYTALDGRGSCVLRYRTGDIAEGGIVYDPCPNCGRVTARISTTLSRRSDMNELNLTKIRGTLVDLNSFLPSMAGIPEVLEWQLVIKKVNDDPNELDELVLYIAVSPECDETTIKERVSRKLLNDTEVSPNQIEVRPLAQLAEQLGLDTQMKELRIRDLRKLAKIAP